jgi:hypothetical protein
MCAAVQFETVKGRDYLKDLDKNGRMTLKQILSVDCTYLAQDMIQCRALLR